MACTLDSKQVEQAHELIEKAQRIVIVTHMAPDGDAMGSALAVYHYVMDRFAVGSKTACAEGPQAAPAVREVSVIVPNAFPAFFNWMPGVEQVKVQKINDIRKYARVFFAK